MTTFSLDAAQKDLIRLIDRAQAGEEIVITRDDEPVARLVAVTKVHKPRKPGRLEGHLDLPDEFFFDPLPADELKLWSGDDEPSR
jgi:prevent-host-death family protein